MIPLQSIGNYTRHMPDYFVDFIRGEGGNDRLAEYIWKLKFRNPYATLSVYFECTDPLFWISDIIILFDDKNSDEYWHQLDARWDQYRHALNSL